MDKEHAGELEGLDDINSPEDDAWAEAVRELMSQNTVTKEPSGMVIRKKKRRYLPKEKELSIIAKRGDDAYLVKVGKDTAVVVTKQGSVTKPWRIESTLARGDWDEYAGSSEETEEIMKIIGEVGDGTVLS